MRTGDWIATFSGQKWFITDPHPDDVRIEDIAHGLANICRFGGHCREFYSVAQHSYLVALTASQRGLSWQTQLWGLLHDAPEAYLGDVVRPLKHSLPDYKKLESHTEFVILDGLKIAAPPTGVRSAVKLLDDVLLMTERRDLINHRGIEWTQRAEPLDRKIEPWKPALAERQFLALYQSFTEGDRP